MVNEFILKFLFCVPNYHLLHRAPSYILLYLYPYSVCSFYFPTLIAFSCLFFLYFYTFSFILLVFLFSYTCSHILLIPSSCYKHLLTYHIRLHLPSRIFSLILYIPSATSTDITAAIKGFIHI